MNHADFRRFYAGQLISLIGSWMQTVAQAWLVLQLTDSAFKLGLVGTLQFGPLLFLAVVAGVLADRMPKRRLLVATQTALGGQALTLALLVGGGYIQYWHVCLLALLMGVVNALDLPLRQSFVVELVGKDDLVSAVALNSAAFNAARIVGPSVAGLVIAHFGTAPAFLMNGLSFAVVIAALLAVGAEGRPVRRRGATMAEEIREGVRYAVRTPRIRVVLSMLFVVSLCVFNFTVYIPLFARKVLAAGPEEFGFLMASVGVGAVAGALGLGMLQRQQPALVVIFTAAAIACAGLLAMAAVRRFAVAVPILFVIGFSSIIAAAGVNSNLQLSAPDELRGRVMSLYTLVFGGVFPLGSFLVGAIAQSFGVPAAFLAGGGAGLLGLTAVGGWWILREARREHPGVS